ncbi:hypothetical protein QOZ80_9BG0694760 [Eleusine coracana subsp. coracana]|nr:hypothetical protein QOZ80_9BG0694760 [Eleusine coracana subsp. coracana]
MDMESYPSWLLLWLRCGDEEMEFTGFAAAAETTTAASFTSDGYPILVSLGVAPPPAVSCIYVQSPDNSTSYHRRIIAAHGDSVLVRITFWRRSEYMMDHFIYSVGASQPPSLRLLLACYFDVSNRKSLYTEVPRGVFVKATREPGHRETPQRMLDENATGLLLRGKDAFMVVELLMAPSQLHNPAAEILLLRSGKWTVKRVPICVASDKCRKLSLWRTDTVVPVGDRMLCWVDLSIGIIVADVFDDRSGLRYVSLPVKRLRHIYSHRKEWRNVCATAGGAVKLIDIIINTTGCED